MKFKTLYACALVATIQSSPSYAIFWSGNGFYSLRAVSQTNPDQDRSAYQAFEQHLGLNAEARVNDRSSFFLGLSLDPTQPKSGLLGGDSTSNTVDTKASTSAVSISSAYARLGTDYCLIEAGRRPRNWGLGILYSASKKPFQSNESVFDGVTCDVNIQKSQTLGFSVGVDKISESSGSLSNQTSKSEIDQYFFTIEYDDKLSEGSAPFTKKIGIYAANLTSPYSELGGQTDIKYLDIYGRFTGFKSLALLTELVFRNGKSKDPAWISYGSAASSNATVDSIGLASRFEFTLSASGLGADVNPSIPVSKHLAFFEYVRAPGDKDAYYRGSKRNNIADSYDAITSENSDNNAQAMAFNRNFKPLLILFNGRESGKNDLPGVYESNRMVNATVTSLGYKFESNQNGVFELKLAKAKLLETAPSGVSSYWAAITDANSASEKTERTARGIDVNSDQPVGLSSSDLGTELDLTYTLPGEKDFKTTLMASYLKTGAALDTSRNTSLKPKMLISAQFELNF